MGLFEPLFSPTEIQLKTFPKTSLKTFCFWNDVQLYHFPDIIDLNKLSQYYWSGFSVFATINWFYSCFSTGFRKLYLVHKKCHRCHWFMLNVIQLPANKYNKLQNDYICTLLSSKITRVRGGGGRGLHNRVKHSHFFFHFKFSISYNCVILLSSFLFHMFLFFDKGIKTSHSGEAEENHPRIWNSN